MRHKCGFRKLSRSSSHRAALFRSLATSLIRHGEIETTVEKAKELRPVAEKLITLAKEDTVHHRRRAYSYIYDKEVVQKLFNQVGPNFKDRPGGYLRIVRTRLRAGDNAEMAIISFVADKVAKAPVAKVV